MSWWINEGQINRKTGLSRNKWPDKLDCFLRNIMIEDPSGRLLIDAFHLQRQFRPTAANNVLRATLLDGKSRSSSISYDETVAFQLRYFYSFLILRSCRFFIPDKPGFYRSPCFLSILVQILQLIEIFFFFLSGDEEICRVKRMVVSG